MFTNGEADCVPAGESLKMDHKRRSIGEPTDEGGSNTVLDFAHSKRAKISLGTVKRPPAECRNASSCQERDNYSEQLSAI